MHQSGKSGDAAEMQIVLMRHGKPVLPAAQWLAPCEMGRWIDDYDRSIVELDDIPAASVNAAREAAVIVASTLSRSLSSVHALGRVVSLVDSVFCEAELPYALWRRPPMPAQIWAAVFRLCWLFGYARGADSVSATKERASRAARRLEALARKGPVLLVGHGIMNRLIAKELLASGWRLRAGHNSKYWSTSEYYSST